MKPISRKDSRLKKNFDRLKDLKGIVPDAEIRSARRKLKRVINKNRRNMYKSETDELIEEFEEEFVE